MKSLLFAVPILFAAACFADAPVAEFCRRSGLADHVRDHRWAEAIKFFGTAWFAVVAAAVLLAGSLLDRKLSAPGRVDFGTPDSSVRPSLWRSPVRVLLAAALSGLNILPKWMVGQSRPFKPDGTAIAEPFRLHPFFNGIDGLFHEKDLSFPSGHACTAAAVVTAVALARPRWRWFLAGIAVVVGIERVIENAHYVDDVIAGWALGYFCAVVARWVIPAADARDPRLDAGS